MHRMSSRKSAFVAPRVLLASSLLLGALSLAVIGFASGSGPDWAIVPSPNETIKVTQYSDTSVNAVTCISSSDCWAIGYSANGNIAEHWDGTEWATVAMPNIDYAGYNRLRYVSCVSSSDCWAAGSYLDTSFNGGEKTLLEHWDGTSWVIV